jgi:membrane-bound lytic murein transglycosylase D
MVIKGKIVHICTLLILTILPFTGQGQNIPEQQINARALYPVSLQPDTIDADMDDEIQIPGKGVDSNLDSLLSVWYMQRALNDTIGVILLEGEDMPPAALHDSVYIRRLGNLSSVISLPYNDIIRNNIVFYTQKMPEKMEMILGLSDYYLPQFEEILDMYGLPLELKILPIIESALNPLAVSRVGATGMWQFMLRTGRQYNLTINSFVDERRDPIASAHAAAQYLSDMYKIFGDWTLVIASYNCGAGNVRKAIKRANGKTDYWDIYPYLPSETRGYVPAFIAATYAVNYYREHKLTPKTLALPAVVDTFMINQNLHFEQISETIGIPVDELRDLNPQYRQNIIPGKERPYELRIPFEYTYAYIEKEAEMYAKDSIYFNPKTIANVTKATASRSSAEGKQQGIHRVQKGETLGGIAEKYGIKLSDLRYWNNLTEKSKIFPKQKLIVYSPQKKAATTETTAAATTTASNDKNTTTVGNTAATKKPIVATTGKTIYHMVKKGETLWGISQQYDDVSFYDLMKINGLTKNSKLKIGQKIKIK